MAKKILIRTPKGLYLLEGDLVKEVEGGGVEERVEAILEGRALEEVGGIKADATTSPIMSRVLNIPLTRDVKVDEELWAGEDVRSALIEYARRKGVEEWKEEGAIISAVGTLKDLQKGMNLLKERIVDWVSGYWSEAEDMDVKTLMERLSAGEWGVEGPEENEKDAIASLAREMLHLMDEEKRLESFLKEEMERRCPNLSAVATLLLGAQLIALAGGLRRLATFPSSTVQLLGAEKGFFRYLKEGGRPPKHGAIFQHPSLHRAKPWNRGRVARAISGKISIAAKLDLAGRDMGEALKEELARRLDDIEKRYPTPPKRRGGKGRRGGRR